MKYFIDWKFFLLTVGVLAAPGLAYLVDVDPRYVGWNLAALAAALLFWRLIGWFGVTPTGMRMLAAAMIVSLGLGAWGQYLVGSMDQHVPNTIVTYLLISQRLMCIGIGLYWTRWTETTKSPFVRERI